MRPGITGLTVTEGNDQFYPTPDSVAGKMLAGIDWDMIETVLEPSAGKGNLVEAAIKAHGRNSRRGRKIAIDCIEIDPYLRSILKYNFGGGRIQELYDRKRPLDHRAYNTLSKAEQEERMRLEGAIRMYNDAKVHVIHDDFLTYRGRRGYSLILMNPPFADGDLHLLKALELQKDGGVIVCLLNAETLLNLYTHSRKILKQELERHGAQVTFLRDAFRNAERRADVDVAIVRVNILHKTNFHSTIWERMEKAAEAERIPEIEVEDLVIWDVVEQSVQRYNVEVAASMELIREYHALRPYITRVLSPDKSSYDNGSILTLTVGTDSNYLQTVDVDAYLRAVRLKYWRDLFDKKEFVGRLTSNLRETYQKNVDRMADYDFTLFNIRTVMVEMNAQIVDGVKNTILALFDKLTAEHSWYAETKQNIHYYNGWATNKAHKIGKKSIIPTYGMFASHSWSRETFSVSKAYEVISDIEKVFNYLDGNMTAEVDLLTRLRTAETEGQTRNIECKYFKVDLFKKGKTHIKFTNMDLVEKLNIYAARNKKWLPPNYGKARYSDMTTEEKAVVDDFQGAAAYERVMSMAGYFLTEPTRSVGMLTDGQGGNDGV